MTEQLTLRGLNDCRFVNRFAALPESYYSRVCPAPLPEPRLVALSKEAAALIDLDDHVAFDHEFTEIMAGNRLLPQMEPVASVYAGHQFGVYVPKLGDGRAILLGEVRNARGDHWELQLKGAGKTPYARFADGRAVLRSTVREYLASEALHALGIPTTRALSIISSPLEVQRETVETAAVLCRMAPSHIRFGHFEYFFYRDKLAELAPLADHVIMGHFPELWDRPNRYAAWLTEVVERTARLMAQWQANGFIHGVMNTDNFSVLGLTIDYGPYGFMDDFDAHRVFNHTDETGRYAWDQQPQIGYWNVSQLLQATLPLLDPAPNAAVELATSILNRYPAVFGRAMRDMWAAKLGLRDVTDADRPLINGWLTVLDEAHADFTLGFRRLSEVRTALETPPTSFDDKLLRADGFAAWLDDYRARLRSQGEDDADRAARMDAVNPLYVLRNHVAQRAVDRAQAGDYAEIETVHAVMSRPFTVQPGMERYEEEPPDTMRHIPLSCSS